MVAVKLAVTAAVMVGVVPAVTAAAMALMAALLLMHADRGTLWLEGTSAPVMRACDMPCSPHMS
jgi:hypothetical protein